MSELNSYSDDLRMTKSLLIVTALQARSDLKARQAIEYFDRPLVWTPQDKFMIDSEVWEYAVNLKKYNPALVFCHPEILQYAPSTSLYYRGLCGLSMKAAKDYFGSIENLEKGSAKTKLNQSKAWKMTQIYNTFICSIIKNSIDWTLDIGKWLPDNHSNAGNFSRWNNAK